MKGTRFSLGTWYRKRGGVSQDGETLFSFAPRGSLDAPTDAEGAAEQGAGAGAGARLGGFTNALEPSKSGVDAGGVVVKPDGVLRFWWGPPPHKLDPPGSKHRLVIESF